MLDEEVAAFKGDLYPESMATPPANLVQERRFLVAYNPEFAIYINKADHGPPHIHIVRHAPDSQQETPSTPREARFLLVDDLINGVRVEPFPYTDPQSRKNGQAAAEFPERTVDGKNAKRKYSLSTIEREKARQFGNQHAQNCLQAWQEHISPIALRYPDEAYSLDDTTQKLTDLKAEQIPITDKTVQRFLQPWDSRYEHRANKNTAPAR